jgi:archaellum component FlaG (FlaF/FlaG flagellin family)
MADGGATSMLMMVVALLVSGIAGVVLVDSWGDISQTLGKQRIKAEMDASTQIDFSGDPMTSIYVTVDPEDITFYLQNSGTQTLDTSSVGVMVDGVSIPTTDITVSVLGGGDWASGQVVSVNVEDSDFTFSDGDEVKVSIVVMSEQSRGVKGADTLHGTLRLKV